MISINLAILTLMDFQIIQTNISKYVQHNNIIHEFYSELIVYD